MRNSSIPARFQAHKLAVLISLMVLPLAGAAEVYKWVDSNGRVHFSDKKHAHQQAERLGAEQETADPNSNHLTLHAEADAILSRNSSEPRGNTPVLSAGNWNVGGTTVQNVSLLRFDLSELLRVVNASPGKQLHGAQLQLFANTDVKLYGQGVNNQEPPGHSTLNGDNAFYLKASHNSWEEAKVTWEHYYSSNHYVPSAIRALPSVAVAGSASAGENFSIDITELVAELIKNNIREVTLEMRLQRLPKMAQVTFHSRESQMSLRPALMVELLDNTQQP